MLWREMLQDSWWQINAGKVFYINENNRIKQHKNLKRWKYYFWNYGFLSSYLDAHMQLVSDRTNCTVTTRVFSYDISDLPYNFYFALNLPIFYSLPFYFSIQLLVVCYIKYIRLLSCNISDSLHLNSNVRSSPKRKYIAAFSRVLSHVWTVITLTCKNQSVKINKVKIMTV